MALSSPEPPAMKARIAAPHRTASLASEQSSVVAVSVRPKEPKATQEPTTRPEPKEELSAIECRRALEASGKFYPSKWQRTAGSVPQSEGTSVFNAPQVLASPLYTSFLQGEAPHVWENLSDS